MESPTYTEIGHKLRFCKIGFGGLKRTEVLPQFVEALRTSQL
jgi:hypothetical protein